ncbi:MAG: sigma-70 family RNA polymerase sigma factor [Acidobacteriota bacterium]
MTNISANQITEWLVEWGQGNQLALEQLMPLVYDELRRMARRYMRNQPSGHTLQTTDLIHEAYLKLASGADKDWQNRAHFYGVAAQAMRHILVDYARSRQSQKRGGAVEKVTLDETALASFDRADEVVALNDALEKLAVLDERKGRVVELKYFGGLTHEEIATILKISSDTVKHDWRFARTWLLRELSKQ